MNNKLLQIINTILSKKGDKITEINLEHSLRKDLGFDSLDLAELTVRIEDEFEIDIFEDGIVDTIDEIIRKIER